MNQLLLTGATGFIGSHVLEALVAAGFPVVVLARPGSDVRFVGTVHAETRLGDVRDPGSLRAALRGCRQVVHVAGLARDWGTRDEFEQTNVMGTLNVLKESLRAEVEQVVLTGSISSYGEEDSTEVKNESSPFRSHYPYFLDRLFPCALNHYRDSKARATAEAIAFGARQGLNVTILEPAWVFGEREFHTGFYAYLEAVRNGCRWMPGSSQNVFQVIYAPDLAQAYVSVCRVRPGGVQRFIIANPHPEPMQELFDRFCDAASLPRPRRLPKSACYPAGFILELGATMLRRREAPLLTRGRVNMFYDSIRYSSDKASRTLGFRPRFPIAEAISHTVAWYRQQNLL